MSLKKISITVFAITLGISIISSCKKTTTSTSKVAFTNATMKPWFDTYCASCHASGKSDSGKWLYDPADYDGSIKAEISTLYREVYTKKSMPEGTSLSTSELAKFKNWYDAGYTAN